MIQTFTRILITIITLISISLAQSDKKEDLLYQNANQLDISRNRLPELLEDVKVLLSDAFISDVMSDTLEVIYSLNRIFDLLSEADQYGEMDDEDQEEFSRFETSLVELYTNRFNTLDKMNATLTAGNMRRDITSMMEPLEVEMGASQFTVIEDRDGHVPLVRNKKVDQFIKYFETKGRKQFEIWLDRLEVYGPMISQILEECNVPPEIIYLAMIESGLNPKAYSKAAANGMWQFVYATGKRYGLERTWYVDERRDPEKATRAACAYLTDLYGEFDNYGLGFCSL